MPKRTPTPQELEQYLDARISEEGDCWVWTGPTDTWESKSGTYTWPVLGLSGMTGKHVRRAIYQLVYPAVDLTGKRVKWRGEPCHPLCIRPSHQVVEDWPKRSEKYADDTPTNTNGPLARGI